EEQDMSIKQGLGAFVTVIVALVGVLGAAAGVRYLSYNHEAHSVDTSVGRLELIASRWQGSEKNLKARLVDRKGEIVATTTIYPELEREKYLVQEKYFFTLDARSGSLKKFVVEGDQEKEASLTIV